MNPLFLVLLAFSVTFLCVVSYASVSFWLADKLYCLFCDHDSFFKYSWRKACLIAFGITYAFVCLLAWIGYTCIPMWWYGVLL